MASRPGLFRRFFGFLWNAVGFLRNLALNLLFLAIVVAIAAAWLYEARPTLAPNTARPGVPSQRIDHRAPDTTLGERLEHFRGEAGFGADTDADDADLGDRIVVDLQEGALTVRLKPDATTLA